jgi:hypothetical protein
VISDRLYLVGSRRGRGPAAPTRWEAPPYDLDQQPQRPGELCAEIRIANGSAAADVHRRAADVGLPSTLWATLAVESHRTVELTGTLLGLSAPGVRAVLDEQIHTGEEPTGTRLGDYARALTHAHQRKASFGFGAVLLRPSTTQITAWTLAAAADGVSLEAWVLARLQSTPSNSLQRWEASAAIAGQTLCEWALVQTARRLRPASTLAHAAG